MYLLRKMEQWAQSISLTIKSYEKHTLLGNSSIQIFCDLWTSLGVEGAGKGKGEGERREKKEQSHKCLSFCNCLNPTICHLADI